MTSPRAARMIAEGLAQPGARIGTVTTAGSTPIVAVDGGAPITVRYMAQGLTVAVNDRVLLVRAAGNVWVLTARLNTPATPALAVTKRFAPTRCWVKGAPLAAAPGSWTSQVEYITLGSPAAIFQGQDTSQTGADNVVTPQNLIKYATVLHWGTLASLVPSLSTILDVSLRFTRELQANARLQPPLTFPRLYGSLYSVASPPNALNPPTAVAGHGPLPSVAIAPGQSTTIALPATWITDWLAGTITSLHLYSDQRSDIIRSLGTVGDVELIVTYLPPPD